MIKFRVWVRPLGSECRVRVDGMQNTKWLLDRLSRSFVFKTAEPVHKESDSLCIFRIRWDSRTFLADFEKLLLAIPEVALMTDPE